MLWGRVVVLGVVLLLVFLLGRATSGSSAEIKQLQERLSDREAEIDQLEAAGRATPTPAASVPADGAEVTPTDGTTGGTTTTISPTPSASPTPSTTTTASPTPAANTEAQTYTVQSGDNFGKISAKFYGSTAFAKCIQTANQVEDASKLQSGKSITIPPKPAAACT